ncbi:hypothetical protein DPX16_0601 [Anabarilius grahami]|uniref:Uncharacterized protein n=1 Tax=Anabarilius grahami TaxID=495550 RepID=A0A3N0Z5G5_ANAGA|nr:hypothetical protein DPX16_0601 [Anabarilius grahami]
MDELLGRVLLSVGLVCQGNFGPGRCRREPTPQSNFVASSSSVSAWSANLQYELASRYGCKYPSGWDATKMVGKDWLTFFLERSSTLSIRRPEAASMSRSTSFNKTHVLTDSPVRAALEEDPEKAARSKEKCLFCDLWSHEACREPVTKRQRFASSMEDPLLASVRTAGFPKPIIFSPPALELIPLSAVLPIMGVALWCTWAAYITAESPEVAAYAAEPHEVVVLASATCTVVASSDTLSSCPESAPEAVCKHLSCLDPAPEAVCELLSCPESATEAIYDSFLFSDSTTVEPPEVVVSAADPLEV